MAKKRHPQRRTTVFGKAERVVFVRVNVTEQTAIKHCAEWAGLALGPWARMVLKAEVARVYRERGAAVPHAVELPETESRPVPADDLAQLHAPVDEQAAHARRSREDEF